MQLGQCRFIFEWLKSNIISLSIHAFGLRIFHKIIFKVKWEKSEIKICLPRRSMYPCAHDKRPNRTRRTNPDFESLTSCTFKDLRQHFDRTISSMILSQCTLYRLSRSALVKRTYASDLLSHSCSMTKKEFPDIIFRGRFSWRDIVRSQCTTMYIDRVGGTYVRPLS